MLVFGRRRGAWRITLAVLLSLGFIPAVAATPTTAALAQTGGGAATPAFDYTKVKGLSRVQYDYSTQVIRETLQLFVPDADPADTDKIGIYLEITRPNDGARHPVILESSPYHGTLADRDGTRILPEPRDADGKSLGLTKYFAPRGYAVVMMDLRGTGKSEGCLDHIGPRDRNDIKAVIEWIARQGWSNGRVGMTGHSYVGSTPSAAAAVAPPGLVTIVPSAGLATMYDHQFQGGVPYFLQWAGPMFAYEQLSLERHFPGGDHEGKDLESAGCGLPNSSLVSGEDQLSGRYNRPWHSDRDWRKDATNATIPVFMVHGVNDNAARVPGMQWFTERGGRAGDKIWLGQWDHGSGCCPTRRGIQWTYALHAWFDKHLAQRNVDTGPAAEMFLSDGTFEGARAGDRSQVLVSSAWPVPGASTLTLYPDADTGALTSTKPALPGAKSFTGDPRGFVNRDNTGGVEFATAPMTADTVLAGQPKLDLVASVTVERVHLIANLIDQFPPDETGKVVRRRIGQFALNPELRNGIDRLTPVVPGAPMTMQPPGFAVAHNLRAGHKLVLRVTASDPDKVPTFAVDPRITVHTGPTGTALSVPVVGAPTLRADTVPLEVLPRKVGEAQATIRGSVTPAAPGAGERIEGVSSVFFEFDVLSGKDNAALLVTGVPSLPADIDMYLQRQQADGSWTGDIGSGVSSSLTEEVFRVPRPSPGHYRVEVHNWAGLPATRVDLTLEFLNSAGVPGPDA